jgi:hypothetical protein
MGLADYLEKIQNKPRHVRVVIMWVGVAIFMTFFLILWAATLNSGQKSENLATDESFSEQAQTFQEVKSEIPSLWQSLKASVSGLFNSLNQTNQNAPSVQIEGGGQDSGNSKVPPSTLP